MEKIAMIVGRQFLYWPALLLAAGAVCGILLFLGLWLGEDEEPTAGLLAVPLALGLSLVLSRLTHWYCRTSSYASFRAAMTDYSTGGFALMGAFLGCLLAAGLLRLLRVQKHTAKMLDCMSLAGCLAIAVGRLGSLFQASDRGWPLPQSVGLPWAWPVTNAVTGQTENRLATFLLQAMAAAVLLCLLLILRSRGRKKGTLRDGDLCLIFLLCYGASQVVLDSTRYDSLFLRSNGFVSAVQILGAGALLLSGGVFLARAVRSRGKKWLLLLIPMLALVGAAGYMEYHVQRHGDQAIFAYSLMSLCLGGYVLCSLAARYLAGRPGKVLSTS